MLHLTLMEGYLEVCEGRGACAFYIPHTSHRSAGQGLFGSLAEGARAFKGRPDFVDALVFAVATRSISR